MTKNNLPDDDGGDGAAHALLIVQYGVLHSEFHTAIAAHAASLGRVPAACTDFADRVTDHNQMVADRTHSDGDDAEYVWQPVQRGLHLQLAELDGSIFAARDGAAHDQDARSFAPSTKDY